MHLLNWNTETVQGQNNVYLCHSCQTIILYTHDGWRINWIKKIFDIETGKMENQQPHKKWIIFLIIKFKFVFNYYNFFFK